MEFRELFSQYQNLKCRDKAENISRNTDISLPSVTVWVSVVLQRTVDNRGCRHSFGTILAQRLFRFRNTRIHGISISKRTLIQSEKGILMAEVT